MGSGAQPLPLPWNTTLDAIASGSEDATIQSRAAGVKGLSGRVLVRFAHEMNGNWYPWDGFHNGASASAPPINKENNWLYDSSAASLSAFITMATDPYFNP